VLVPELPLIGPLLPNMLFPCAWAEFENPARQITTAGNCSKRSLIDMSLYPSFKRQAPVITIINPECSTSVLEIIFDFMSILRVVESA
jgi:hypothetical protein